MSGFFLIDRSMLRAQGWRTRGGRGGGWLFLLCFPKSPSLF